MKTIRLTTLVAVTALFSSVLVVNAKADPSAADILNDLHTTNRAEIHMGQLAQQKGSASDVRDYGKTLESDHTSADKKVADVAQKEGITLKEPSEGIGMKMTMKKLDSSSGVDFDKAFANDMVEDHKKDINKLQSAQKSGSLPSDVRELIADLLPTLQQHLETAQKISGQYKS